MFRKFLTLMIALAVFSGMSAYAQTVDEVIQKNIDAHGGLAKMKEIKTIKMTGKMTMPQGMEAPVVYMKKRPNAVRMEMTMQGTSLSSGSWRISVRMS